MNDAPALNLDADLSTIGGVDYLTSFTDGGGAVPIANTDVLITDDNTQLVSATATLTNPDTLDVLAFTELPGASSRPTIPAPTSSRSRAPRRLPTIETALHQITFDNTGTTPSTDTRIIDVVVNDGTAASTWRERSSRSPKSTTVHPPSISTPTIRRPRYCRDKLPRHVHRERDGGRDCGHRHPRSPMSTARISLRRPSR